MDHEAPNVIRSGKEFSNKTVPNTVLSTVPNTVLTTVQTTKEEFDMGDLSVLEFGLSLGHRQSNACITWIGLE